MKKIIFISLFSFFTSLVFAHGGEDHSAGGAKPGASSAKYFSSEASSDLYEVLIKYEPVMPGAKGLFKLFLSDGITNQPIDSADLKITVNDHPKIILVTKRISRGVYELMGTFPNKNTYSFLVSINSRKGPDLFQVEKIEIGKTLAAEEPEAIPHWYNNSFLLGSLGLIAGLLIMYFLMRTRRRRLTTIMMILFCLVPTATFNLVSAHEGEDHGSSAANASAGISTTFLVEKESQFLFDIQTNKIATGDLYQSVELFGTVTASPQGLAVIQTPQTGKIISLRITPGQVVSKGQTLATIEQQVDAGTQIDIISQRNALESEYVAAKAQYERLLKIADIAAKKDITEAKARYETAAKNKQLFNANVGRSAGSTKLVSLTSPISGVVGTFNYAIGAVVNSGETLFEITNLNNVYVEAQVFSGDLKEAKEAAKFTVTPANDTSVYALKMLSTAQAVNTENQSQKVLFQIINPGARFKIGESVKLRMYLNKRTRQLVVPSGAITEVNGKPAVFIKDRAEQFSISYVLKGNNNESVTAITKGIEQDEKVVTKNVYQMKMIFLNQ